MYINKSNAQRIMYLQPYMHLIEAIAEGKTVQCKANLQNTWVNQDSFLFNEPPENYRIKPESTILKTRRYVAKGMLDNLPFISILRHEDIFDTKNFEEEMKDYFIRWIDNDWIYTEV